MSMSMSQSLGGGGPYAGAAAMPDIIGHRTGAGLGAGVGAAAALSGLGVGAGVSNALTRASPADAEEAESHGYGGYAITAYDDECCPPVVDPFTLAALLGFVAAGTAALFALNQSIFGRRRRDFGFEDGSTLGWMAEKYRQAVESIMFSQGEQLVEQVIR